MDEGFYPEILKNAKQLEEWERLFAISRIPGTILNGGEMDSVQWLKDNPFLVLDTKFFDEDFKDRLLADIENLDEQIDGLLINSENFQALSLLQERYRGGVKCIYIDPPYNLGDDDFLYKDNYQHSSWLSMLVDRLSLGRTFATPDGSVTLSIDDTELDVSLRLLKRVYGEGNDLATLVWDRNRKNDATFFSVGHEYMLVYAASKQNLIAKGIKLREPKPGVDATKIKFGRLRKKHKDAWDEIRSEWIGYMKQLKDYELKGILAKYPKFSDRGPYRDDGNINWPGKGGPRYQVLHPKTGKPVKVPKSGWRYSKPERFWEEYEKGNIAFGKDETTVPGIVYYLFESTEQVMGSVFWSYAQTASDEFVALFGDRVFENPKNWRDIRRLCAYLASSDDYIMDYFAGSGTTGHAVINLNREDGGHRKYILVEMGEYFDTVLKPRILKVIYSKDWEDGKPISREGTSHALKYVKLESYEDALNNIAFTHEEDGQEAMELYGDDYVLRYMLDFETRGSETLLNIGKLCAPFRYELNLRNGEEIRETRVDLPETFAYLMGMSVKSRKVHFDSEQRYLVYRGATPERGDVVVIWRDTEGWQEEEYIRDRDFVRESGMGEGADEIFVNGDSFITEARPLEGVFKQRMLAEPIRG